MGLWDEEMELDEAERMMGWQQELERRQR